MQHLDVPEAKFLLPCSLYTAQVFNQNPLRILSSSVRVRAAGQLAKHCAGQLFKNAR